MKSQTYDSEEILKIIGMIIFLVFLISFIWNMSQDAAIQKDLEECKKDRELYKNNLEHMQIEHSNLIEQLHNTLTKVNRCNEEVIECLSKLNLTENKLKICGENQTNKFFISLKQNYVIIYTISIIFSFVVGLFIKPILKVIFKFEVKEDSEKK